MSTVTVKGAAEHTGLTEWRIRQLAIQKKIPHMMAGNKYLFRTETLDKWMDEQEKLSVEPEKPEENQYGKLRKVDE